MPNSGEPARPPMGRLDGFEVGAKTLTVQTEFFHRPSWRVETKVYLAGNLKKVFSEDLSEVPDGELQQRVNRFHERRIEEMMESIRNRKAGKTAPPDSGQP